MLLTLPPNRKWRILKQQQGKYISNQEMKELKTVKADWDLFRRPLIVANARHTSILREILSYEVSPVPSSLVHNDGSVSKVIKSELASVLEKGINVPALPALTDDLIVHIVDGMAFIQVNKFTGSSTFAGELTSTYFTMIVA